MYSLDDNWIESKGCKVLSQGFDVGEFRTGRSLVLDNHGAVEIVR